MRALSLVLGILVVTAGIVTCAQAQNYPWCGQYGGAGGGATNCGFASFEQCLETLRGKGGFCSQNTQYIPPAANSGRRLQSRPHGQS